MVYILIYLSLIGSFDPSGFITVETDRFVFYVRPQDKPLAEEMVKASASIHANAYSIIGAYPTQKVKVIVASDTADYFNLTPSGYHLPDWSVGGAIGSQNLILLDPSRPMSEPPYDYLGVFAHEVAHIYVNALARGHDVPRIIDEGLAMYVAREGTLSRFITLAGAALAGNLIPLSKLMRSFPYNERKAHLAYAQSYHFVNYLIGTYGLPRFQDMIRKIGDGEDPGRALFELTGLSFGALEDDWMRRINTTYAIIPIISSSSLLWFLAAMALVFGYIRRKMENKQRLAEWEEEERRYYGDDDFYSDDIDHYLM